MQDSPGAGSYKIAVPPVTDDTGKDAGFGVGIDALARLSGIAREAGQYT